MEFRNLQIETARLMLRTFTEADAAPLLRIKSNPEFTRFLFDDPWTTSSDALDFIHFASWLYEENQDRDWFRLFMAVERKADGCLLGYCGLGNPEFDPTLVELFYGIEQSQWGKGYATEAGKALLNFGFQEMHLPTIVGLVDPGNGMSATVLEKVGMGKVQVMEGKPHPFEHYNGHLLYQIHRDPATDPA